MKLRVYNNSNLLNTIKPYKKMKLKEINYEKNLSLNNSLNLIHSNLLTKRNDMNKDSTIIINWKKMVNNQFINKNILNHNFQSNSVKNLFDLRLMSKKKDKEINGIYKGSSRNISFEKNFYSLRNINSMLNKSKREESPLKYIDIKLIKDQNKKIKNYNSDYENKIIIAKENENLLKNEKIN